MTTGSSGPGKSTVDVVGVGAVSWDRFIIVPRLPGPNERVKAIRTEEIVGGISTTALVALRRWKLRCRLISSIGYDEHSMRIVDDLTQEGIETDGLIRREDAEGLGNVILVDHRNGQRAMVDDPRSSNAVHHLRRELLRGWWFEEARLMHLETSAELAASGVVEVARQSGMKIMASLHHPLDAAQQEVLRQVDWIMADAWTASEWTKETDPSRAAYALHLLLEVPTVVYSVTDGAHYVSGRQTQFQAGVDVPLVDRTGSGAVFQAGFMYGLLSAWDVARCLRVATWAAGMACREIGGRKGIPSESQMKQFLVQE
jgi:sugar/nucleoside kinase (ribokinase family)